MVCTTSQKNQKMSAINVKLKSSQGDVFVVEREVAVMSNLLKNMIEDSGEDEEIPLPNVKSTILQKVWSCSLSFKKYFSFAQKQARLVQTLINSIQSSIPIPAKRLTIESITIRHRRPPQ